MPWELIIAGGIPSIALVTLVLLVNMLVDRLGRLIEAQRQSQLDQQTESHRAMLRLVEIERSHQADFFQDVDADLRDKRHDHYRQLWTLTGLLPAYPHYVPVRRTALLARSYEMRDWYFEAGGILMTEPTRDAYFAAQKAVQVVLGIPAEKAIAMPEPDNQLLSDADYRTVRDAFHNLRFRLCSDLLLRRAPPSPLAPSDEAGSRRPEGTAAAPARG